jgi:hypothetical protein
MKNYYMERMIITCVDISLTSRRNDCGIPPLNPSEHLTPNDVREAFTTVQLCTWSGRPGRKKDIINFCFKQRTIITYLACGL